MTRSASSEQPPAGADICLKRVYDPPAPDDGARFLVDRLWPRGIKKETLQLTAWLRELAPSDALRRRFSHQPELWDEFCEEYFGWLAERRVEDLQAWKSLRCALAEGRVTFLFAARDTEHNNARALREYILANVARGKM